MKTEYRTLTDIIDTDYLDFAMYTLQSRAIPSVIDGLKPVQRKIIYSMLLDYKSTKVKVAELGGGLAKYNYIHGETSATDAAIKLSAPWNNNLSLLDPYGNFGSRMIQESAAPRYIYTSLSPTFKKFFIDEEVATKSLNNENPEPMFYLPIIPWVLVNGCAGMAVGFKCSILPRSTKDVINATKAYLKNPKKFLELNEDIQPTFPQFSGNIIKHSENQWKTTGIVNYIGKYTYEITELPIGYDRESYINVLNDLIDKELIKDYSDECAKSGFGFRVKVSLSQKENIDKDPLKYFKLEKIHTEILTTLGYDGKLKIFNSVSELIAYFCDYRLTKFKDKIDYDIDKIEKEIKILSGRRKFINEVVTEQIEFKNTTKKELLGFIYKWVTTEDYGKQFASIPLYQCTTDEILSLDNTIKEKQKELVTLKTTTPERNFDLALKGLK